MPEMLEILLIIVDIVFIVVDLAAGEYISAALLGITVVFCITVGRGNR